MDSRLHKTNLISAFLECVFYGIFLILFIISTSLLAFRWRVLNQSPLAAEKRLRISLLVYIFLGFMMFLCLTGVLVFSWMRFLSPNSLGTTTKSGLFLHFGVGDVSLTPAIFGRAVLFVTTSIFSDIILTYRLWVIFGGSPRAMAIPYLIWLGFLRLIVNYIIYKTISSVWLMSLILVSIGLNVYFTASVLYHFRKARKVARYTYGGAGTTRALAIVIESAAVYTAWLLVLVITTLVHADEIAEQFAGGVAPVAGIVTMLVNVRVGLGWAWVAPSVPSSGTAATFGSGVTLTNGVMESERYSQGIPWPR